jgi:hypothetical protein
MPNPNSDKTKFNVYESYENSNKRIYMITGTKLVDNNGAQIGTANGLDVFRWDKIKEMWVPAGLHYNNTSWESFNLKDVYNNLPNTDLYKKYVNDVTVIN